VSELSAYADRFQSARLERRGGILQITLHTGGGALRWSLDAHRELPELFQQVGDDRENKVVILTGSGDEFTGPRVTTAKPKLFDRRISFDDADRVVREGKALLMNFLNIDVPIISALNGPAWRHGELPLLADIVIATESTRFQDSAHFPGGQVPGDGMHVVMPLLLGPNRGRYFLLTGETLDAHKALALGLVAEVVTPDRLLPRAWELAAAVAKRPPSLVRLTRAVLTEQLRRHMQDLLGFGLYIEMFGLSYLDEDKK
jgi:enoyl-CoA hydratase/carnithine racemase